MAEPPSPVDVPPHVPSIVKLSTGSFDDDRDKGEDEDHTFTNCSVKIVATFFPDVSGRE